VVTQQIWSIWCISLVEKYQPHAGNRLIWNKLSYRPRMNKATG